MFVRSRKPDCPDSFPFPFIPYTIQDQFMRALYSVIENRKIGIFESPTGTGKTLSLMCSALKWLADHENLNLHDLREQIHVLEADIESTEKQNSKTLNWLDGQYDLIQKKEQLVKFKEQLNQIEQFERKVIEMRKKWQSQQKSNSKLHRKFTSQTRVANRNSVEDLLNDDGNKVKLENISAGDDEFVIEDTVEDEEEKDEETDVEDENRYRDTKIFFCSRTHSQLTQVVNELKKTIYGQSIRIVQLASRQQLCINADVRTLKSNALINERCLELKKGKVKSKCCGAQQTQRDLEGQTTKKSKVVKSKAESCPFYAQSAIENVSQTTLYNTHSIMDIEELIEEAKLEKGCPYYAARNAAKDAQVIMLPYQMLLHKKTRKQLDISIKDSVIIIDEAHNLLDTIANIHSAEITADQLQQTHKQLSAYKTKYFDRFSTRNLLRLNQLISIANRFMKFLMQPSLSPSVVGANEQQSDFLSHMIFTHELLDDANISAGNLYEILKFCDETRLAQKVGGFALRYGNDEVFLKPGEKPKQTHATYLQQLQKQQLSKAKKFTASNGSAAHVAQPENDKRNENQNQLGSASVLRMFLAFLECLLEKSTDCRILISKHRTLQSKSIIKYLLLNPSGPFEELLNECRTVIVAGGTMQPTTEFKTQIFNGFAERIEEHFFGHVVASDSILPLVVGKGPRNSSFLFNFANRGNKEMLADLSMMLQNVCNVVPAGIVCFFTSYDIMDNFYKYLSDTKALEKIQLKKKVFKESRSGGQQTEKMLLDYAKAIKSRVKCTELNQQTGAFMMSVVGGKLSEGLNFSDDLGRCVCIVGLPFPNKMNPELAEKMKYLDKIAATQKQDNAVATTSLNVGGRSFSSGEYYENLCMKAVNQCIGRAIRHVNDYAAVLLIDERYRQERIQQKLPQWIRASLMCPKGFGGVQGSLVKFFRQKSTDNNTTIKNVP